MEEVQAQKDGAINLWESPMIPKTGVFEWSDSLKTVVFRKFDSDLKADKFKSKFQDRVTHVKRERNDQEYQKRINKLTQEMRSKAASESRPSGGDPSSRPITFLDCKAVALNEMLVNRQPIPDTFLEFFLQTVSHAHCTHCQQLGTSQQHSVHRTDVDSGPPFDQLMASLAIYFNFFFAKKDADEVSDDLHVSRSQAEEQMIAEVVNKMNEAAKQFGIIYNTMILGLGMDQLHHMNKGKCRVSTTLTDRQMFEALYSYAVEFIWIVFGRRDREVVKKEVGRLLRSDSFNRALRTTYNAAKKPVDDAEPDVANTDPAKLVYSKNGKLLKDTQILSLIDRMGGSYHLSRSASGQEIDKKSSPRTKKEASAHGSNKSARTSSTGQAKGRSKSVEDENRENEEEMRPVVQKPLVHKKRGPIQPANPLTDEQILACIDRMAVRYEEAIKTALAEHASNRSALKRPPKKSLMEQRSVAAECVLPRVKPVGGDRKAPKTEEVNPFFKPVRADSATVTRYINVRKLLLGIIGQPLINYNSSSLIPLLNASSNQQGANQANAPPGTTIAAGQNAVTSQPGAGDTMRTMRGKNVALMSAESSQPGPLTRETTTAIEDAEEVDQDQI